LIAIERSNTPKSPCKNRGRILTACLLMRKTYCFIKTSVNA
jgi:hypothetical protein